MIIGASKKRRGILKLRMQKHKATNPVIPAVNLKAGGERSVLQSFFMKKGGGTGRAQGPGNSQASGRLHSCPGCSVVPCKLRSTCVAQKVMKN